MRKNMKLNAATVNLSCFKDFENAMLLKVRMVKEEIMFIGTHLS